MMVKTLQLELLLVHEVFTHMSLRPNLTINKHDILKLESCGSLLEDLTNDNQTKLI